MDEDLEDLDDPDLEEEDLDLDLEETDFLEEEEV